MLRELSPNAIPSLLANSTTEEWILLLTISHPDWPTTIRLAKRRTPIISRGNQYAEAEFRPVPPAQAEGEFRRWTVALDNTDLSTLALLRSINIPRPDIVVELIRAADPDTVEMSTGPGYKVFSYSHDFQTIQLDIAMHNLVGEGFPGGTYLPSTHPGGF